MHRAGFALIGMFAAGCYLSHERERVEECAIAPREQPIAEAPSGETMVAIASDGCARVAAAWVERGSGTRLIVARSDDGGETFVPLHDEEVEDLHYWDLALDERGEPILVTFQQLEVAVRRVEGGVLGEPIVLSTPGERAAIAGPGGIIHNSRLVQAIRGGGAFITFWEWERPSGAVVVARVGAEGAPQTRRFGGQGREARACLAPDGTIAVTWLEGGGTSRTAVGPGFDGPFTEASLDGALAQDIACEPAVLVAYREDEVVRLAQWDAGRWMEVARYPGSGTFPNVQLYGGPSVALVAMTTGYDELFTRIAAWSPSAGARDPIALEGEPVVLNGCAHGDGISLITAAREHDLTLLSFDESGSIARETPIVGVPRSYRGNVSCASDAYDLVAFQRSDRAWLASIAR